nr:hypothetical protein [Burkholderia contaminans]
MFVDDERVGCFGRVKPRDLAPVDRFDDFRIGAERKHHDAFARERGKHLLGGAAHADVAQQREDGQVDFEGVAFDVQDGGVVLLCTCRISRPRSHLRTAKSPFPAFGAAMPSAVRIVTALSSAVPSLPLSMSRMRPSSDVASVKSMPKLPVLKLPRTFTRGRT